MSDKKLNTCQNGVGVAEQVLKYQLTKDYADFLPVQLYYNEFKEQWYKSVEDYIDRYTFDADFDYKLLKAINSFNDQTSKNLADENGWSDAGRFNRWLFRILSNWISNIKNYAFKIKSRPPIQCPICGRMVARIDAEHLQHFKANKDIPKHMEWDGQIIEVCKSPKEFLTTWGKSAKIKWDAIHRGCISELREDKEIVDWPFFMEDGTRGVLCPFTQHIIHGLTLEYLHELPDRHRCYAPNTEWETFIENFPHTLIQSEMFSLDHVTKGEDVAFRECVMKNCRTPSLLPVMTPEMLKNGRVLPSYSDAFCIIEKNVQDERDREILKLLAIGYGVNDVAEQLDLNRKEIRMRMKLLRNNAELENSLVSIMRV